MKAQRHWIIAADGRRAALYLSSHTPAGTLRLEARGEIANQHEDDHEAHRPYLLGGAERRGGVGNGGANVSPKSASFGHEKEEEQRRFVRDIGAWLRQAHRELTLEDVTLFAAPRQLGMLREELADCSAWCGMRSGDFAHLTPPELATAQAVQELMHERELAQRSQP